MLEKPILESFIYIVKILKVSYYSCSSILASLWKSGVQTWEYLAHSSNFSAGWKSLSYILNVFYMADQRWLSATYRWKSLSGSSQLSCLLPFSPLICAFWDTREAKPF